MASICLQLLEDNIALKQRVMELQAQMAAGGTAAPAKASAVEQADCPGTLAKRAAEA